MKTISVHPDLLAQLRAAVEAQPVLGFVLVCVLCAVVATWFARY